MENNNLDNAPEILIALSKFSSSEQDFRTKISNAPTMRNIIETLRANTKDKKIDYHALDNIIVVPEGEDHNSNPLKAVLFGDDNWGCRLKGTEVDRVIDFQKLPARLKFEAKLICLSDLWLLPRISKLGSLFRKGQLAKYHYYDNLIQNAIEHKRSEAQLQYFMLEREFFEDALKEYGVKP